MRFSKNYSKEKYFSNPKRILSENLASFFVFEESILLILIVIQAYKLLGIGFVNGTIQLFTTPLLLQNELWFIGSILFFTIGYVVVALRDESVQIIHKNLFKVLFLAAKAKAQNTTKEQLVFVLGEVLFASILAISIFLYLDPEINIVPAPYNYIAFAFFLGLCLLLFSHTKQYRMFVYGPTPIQKRLYHGKHELKRISNSRTGSIRVVPKKRYDRKNY
ncbi:MAG: hypothetical protein WC746_05870 [archaeon]|jgi:hypothetical protein